MDLDAIAQFTLRWADCLVFRHPKLTALELISRHLVLHARSVCSRLVLTESSWFDFQERVEQPFELINRRLMDH